MMAEYAQLKALSPIPSYSMSLCLTFITASACRMQFALQFLAVDGFNFNGGLVGFQQLDRIAAAAGLPCWHGSEIDLGTLEAMYLHQSAAASSCTWPSDIFGRSIREHDLLVALAYASASVCILAARAGTRRRARSRRSPSLPNRRERIL